MDRDRERQRPQRQVGANQRRGDDSGRMREFRPPRAPEIPDDVQARDLDRWLLAELRTLSKENAEGVARHLVMVGHALGEDDLDTAWAHADAVARRAGRVPGVREIIGVVHYRRAEWAKALAEFRTARRLSGKHHLLPLMADAERGLGRPERALELASAPEAATLGGQERVELAIVAAGARQDLGQASAAVQQLQDLVRTQRGDEPWYARLTYAYSSALEAAGRTDEAMDWLRKCASRDTHGDTDAAERLGLAPDAEIIDLGDDDEEAHEAEPRDLGEGRDPAASQGTQDGPAPATAPGPSTA